MKAFAFTVLCSSLLLLTACNSNTSNTAHATEQSVNNTNQNNTQNSSSISQNYKIESIGEFDEPWALAQLPDGRLLVTQRRGVLSVFDPKLNRTLDVSGVPQVHYGGQGGLGDVVLHPQYANNHWIYLSYAERGDNAQGAVVIRATLDFSNAQQPRLTNITRIWTQVPKVTGEGHYAHRLAFDRAGKLWISSGERQKFDPAQDMNSNLGKILRLNDDGTPVADNPFASQGGVAAQVWSLGHRNPLGIAFDAQGQLWEVEMGPEGGDELNRIVKGENYGYPVVSNGEHYPNDAGSHPPFPDHSTRPEFKAPEITWTPVISPSSMIIYQGNQFPAWKGKALIGGLSSESITVAELGNQPSEVQRLNMKQRIRGLLEAPDGGIWVIEDGKNARLLKLTPP